MKTVICLAYAAAAWLLVYLTGAFVAADFNTANWTDDMRFFVGFAGLACGAAVFAGNME